MLVRGSTPTTRVLAAPCQIHAVIDCLIVENGGYPIQECNDLVDPRTFVCTNDLSATGLAFRYLGGNLGGGTITLPDRVHVEVAGGRPNSVVFSEVVSVGEIFRADGDLRDGAEIQISEVDADGVAGKVLDDLLINTDCDDASLTLTSTFGPLELVGFDNAHGFFSSIQKVQLEYFIGNNDLENGLLATSANITSAFQKAPFDALAANDISFTKNAYELLFPVTEDLYTKVFTETTEVDIGKMFRDDESFAFSMETVGLGEPGLACAANAEFTLSKMVGMEKQYGN